LARFGWLHLSDLHLGLNGSRLLRPEFREAFERDLRRVHERTGPWDVVFLSGNLTHSGNLREFALLESTLGSLWDYFRSLGSHPTLIAVPGEQDFYRPASQEPDPLVTFSASEIRQGFRSPGELQRLFEGRLSNFKSWLRLEIVRWPANLRAGLLPGDFAVTVAAEGMKVGIIGLNSIFRGKLKDPDDLREIHVEQIEAATGGDLRSWALQHAALVLVTHTPPVMLKLSSLAVLREKLMPVDRPFLHLCGGYSRPGWREPRRPWTVQALSLFGETSTDPEHWGYVAGMLSSSGLRLLPRKASFSGDVVALGPDRTRESSDEELEIPLDDLTRVLPLAQPENVPDQSARELAELLAPWGSPSEPTRVPTQQLLARADVPQPAGLPPGVRLQRVLDVGQRPVSALAWAPSGEALGLGLRHGYLAYWESGASNPSWMIRAHQTAITDLVFSPDGKTLLSRSESHLRPWNEQGVAVKTPLEGLAFMGRALAWSSSGLLAADVNIGDNRIRLWDTSRWALRKIIPSPLPSSQFVTRLVWSPDGQTLACGIDGFPSLALWRQGVSEQLQFGTPHGGSILDIAWMPGSALIAVATRTVFLIWDTQANKLVIQLEGHRDWVRSVSFSSDGRLLASIDDYGRVLLFRTDTWERVAEFHASTSALAPWRLAFSPTRAMLAIAASRFSGVQLWDIDVDQLLKSQAPAPTVHEVSAKVVLVGEGRAGKSSLALRLAQDRYEEMDSTHGMRFWPLPEERLGPVDAPPHLRRELILWDMGGQSEYQLVHQLFLRDSAVALMVMEPGRGETALDEIEGWNQRLLTQASAGGLRKLLVGTKLDTEGSAQNLPAIEELVKRCQFLRYVPTSAKTGQGVGALRDALVQAIDWSSLEKVSRPELFQRMRQLLQKLRAAKRVVLTFTELEGELRRELGSEFDPEVLRTVVGPLARQGLVADTRLADGTRVLILEVEQVERYAGSLILAARDNPHGVPALDVAKVLSPAMRFPRLPNEERLRRDQELLVLDCVIELLLEHGICLRHEGLLIFPSLFRLTEGDAGVDFSHVISLHYDFSGPIDNIYASLITSLALSRRFGSMRLKKDRAEFDRAGEDLAGVRRVREGSQGARGQARLDVYFEPSTAQATRELFVNIIEEHLREHGVMLMERLNITCVCGQVFPEDIVRKRLHAGSPDIGCVDCDRRTPLTLGAQQARERDPALVQRLHALRTDIQEMRSQNITETKVSMTEAKSVKASRDTPLRILHLSDLHVGAGDDAVSLLQPLAAALRDNYEGLGLERLDYLVISGDITNRASPAEFEKAREFVSGIIEQFSLTAERCILVPGNHDLDWNTDVYRWEKKRQVDAIRLEKGTFVEQGEGYLLREDAKYPERFKNFSQHFYHPLTQRAYPLEPQEQCLSSLFSESRLQFLAMNSAWEIDEYFPERSSISEQALSRGLAAADLELSQARKRGELPQDARVLRFAVWHHPITGNEKVQADAFMGRLLQADVRVCLHGHVHEDRADLVNYLHADRQLHVVGAGSFGAPTYQRPESVPRLFSLLEVDRDLKRIRVHTRSLRKQGGAWEGWAVWPGEKPGEKRTYYEFTVP
jgi:small GTP-binding protein